MTILVFACQRARLPLVDKVWITMRCLHMSSDLQFMDDKGADNHEVSLRAIKLVCL